MKMPKQYVINNVFKPRWFRKHEKDSEFNIFGWKNMTLQILDLNSSSCHCDFKIKAFLI
jgi:hypothetical protein